MTERSKCRIPTEWKGSKLHPVKRLSTPDWSYDVYLPTYPGFGKTDRWVRYVGRSSGKRHKYQNAMPVRGRDTGEMGCGVANLLIPRNYIWKVRSTPSDPRLAVRNRRGRQRDALTEVTTVRSILISKEKFDTSQVILGCRCFPHSARYTVMSLKKDGLVEIMLRQKSLCEANRVDMMTPEPAYIKKTHTKPR